jgi:hypothetical protein
LGFIEAKSNTSLFVFWRGTDTVYFLLYIDDIVLTASSATLLQQTISALKREFTIKDHGSVHHFLGVSVQHQADGRFLTQHQFALDILERAGIVDCKPVLTSVDTHGKVSVESGPPVADLTHFRSLAGALQYLTFTRPNLAYVVQHICLHMHDSWELPFTAMKHTLHYLWDTLDYGLLLRCSTASKLTVYTDMDWVGCTDIRRSTSSYVVFLSANLIYWSLKHQNVVSPSSVKAEYRVVAKAYLLR